MSFFKLPTGYFTNWSDDTGPYILAPGNVYLLLPSQGSTIVAMGGLGFTKRADGFWIRDRDGSGPFVRIAANSFALFGGDSSGAPNFASISGDPADNPALVDYVDAQAGSPPFASITGDPNSNAALSTALGDKQDTLESGVSIKTINGASVLGSGNIVISGGGGGAPQDITQSVTIDMTAVDPGVIMPTVVLSGNAVLDIAAAPVAFGICYAGFQCDGTHTVTVPDDVVVRDSTGLFTGQVFLGEVNTVYVFTFLAYPDPIVAGGLFVSVAVSQIGVNIPPAGLTVTDAGSIPGTLDLDTFESWYLCRRSAPGADIVNSGTKLITLAYSASPGFLSGSAGTMPAYSATTSELPNGDPGVSPYGPSDVWDVQYDNGGGPPVSTYTASGFTTTPKTLDLFVGGARVGGFGNGSIKFTVTPSDGQDPIVTTLDRTFSGGDQYFAKHYQIDFTASAPGTSLEIKCETDTGGTFVGNSALGIRL